MNPKDRKENDKVQAKMKERRTGNEQGKLANEGGNPTKMKDGRKIYSERDPEPVEKSEEVKEGSFLEHKQVHNIKQKKLVNDTAYFLHHPQIAPHGPSMPPKKPRD